VDPRRWRDERHLIETEADMKAPILNFASALDDKDFAQLFFLYPATDFEEQVKNYDCTRYAVHMFIHRLRL
jgi:hypothetical protein